MRYIDRVDPLSRFDFELKNKLFIGADEQDALDSAVNHHIPTAPAPAPAPAPSYSSGGGGGGESGGGGSSSSYEGPPASDIYTAPEHDPNYGLDGVLAPVDTSGFLIDRPGEVSQATNPTEVSQYMDQYQQWAESGFIDRQVRPEDTVKYQLNQLLDENGQYIQQARQSGKEFAASRGLLNSSLAAGASQRSAIEAGLPIAQQDASTYFSQGINNQNLANQFSLARQNAGMQGIVEMDRLKQTLDAEFAKLNVSVDMFNSENALKAEMFNSTMEFEAAMTAQAQNEARKAHLADLWLAGDTLEANVATTIEGLKVGIQTTQMQISSNESMNSANIAAASQANYLNGILGIMTDPNSTSAQQMAQVDMWASFTNNQPASITNWASA